MNHAHTDTSHHGASHGHHHEHAMDGQAEILDLDWIVGSSAVQMRCTARFGAGRREGPVEIVVVLEVDQHPYRP
ncbi:hypothetical protein ACFY1L_52680 [Streptomyces sp. NPDC001663]|uniref:hypothetical protein n=1 Tax=Streptomyces sp. NPDC001663 TaxID=3364597 RepID=UPI003688FA0C